MSTFVLGGLRGFTATSDLVDRLTKQAHFVPTKTTVNAVDTAELYAQSVL